MLKFGWNADVDMSRFQPNFNNEILTLLQHSINSRMSTLKSWRWINIRISTLKSGWNSDIAPMWKWRQDFEILTAQPDFKLISSRFQSTLPAEPQQTAFIFKCAQEVVINSLSVGVQVTTFYTLELALHSASVMQGTRVVIYSKRVFMFIWGKRHLPKEPSK